MIRIRNNDTGEVRESGEAFRGPTTECDCWLAYWFKQVEDPEVRIRDQFCGDGRYSMLEDATT